MCHLLLQRLKNRANIEISIILSDPPAVSKEFQPFEYELRDKIFEKYPALSWKALGAETVDGNINSAENIDKYSRYNLIVSVRFLQIFKEKFIDANPACKIVNLHSGILPAYRGLAATFRAMLNKEQILGSTIHYIQDRAIDAGDIIEINRFPDEGRSFAGNLLVLYGQAAPRLSEVVGEILDGKEVALDLQEGEGNYYSKLDPSEFEKFKADQGRIYDEEDVTMIRQIFENVNKERNA